jgi:hypothetical protein
VLYGNVVIIGSNKIEGYSKTDFVNLTPHQSPPTGDIGNNAPRGELRIDSRQNILDNVSVDISQAAFDPIVVIRESFVIEPKNV